MNYETKKKLANELKVFNLDLFTEEGYVNETVLDALVHTINKAQDPRLSCEHKNVYQGQNSRLCMDCNQVNP